MGRGATALIIGAGAIALNMGAGATTGAWANTGSLKKVGAGNAGTTGAGANREASKCSPKIPGSAFTMPTTNNKEICNVQSAGLYINFHITIAYYLLQLSREIFYHITLNKLKKYLTNSIVIGLVNAPSWSQLYFKTPLVVI